jgi:NADPH-dependent 2,4-dienoyl-CoA reductase/sulfur reductase-like enzyme
VVGKFVDDPMGLVKRTPEIFKQKQNIDVHIEHEAVSVDLDRRRVLIRDTGSSSETWEVFDHLVIATGSVAIRPPVPGIDGPGVHGMKTMEDGLRLLQVLDSEKPRKAVIIGGGYIGIEMAEAMLNRGCEVALLDMLPQVMGTLDADMAELVAAALSRAGVTLYLGEKLGGFEESGGKLKAVWTDKRTLPADVAILGLGVRPNTKLAADAGVPLGFKNSVRVNDRLRTEVEGVWAVGDCAETFHLVSRRAFWVALGTVANKQGRVAGINIGGGDARFPGVVGTAATKFMETEIARTGLQAREIADLGLDHVSSVIDDKVRAGYYPGSGPIRVKLHAEKGTGRILGGQIVGTQGSAKRIDVIATAIHAGMTAGDIIDLDLGYAPPFSSAWDPIHIAARQTVKQV